MILRFYCNSVPIIYNDPFALALPKAFGPLRWSGLLYFSAFAGKPGCWEIKKPLRFRRNGFVTLSSLSSNFMLEDLLHKNDFDNKS